MVVVMSFIKVFYKCRPSFFKAGRLCSSLTGEARAHSNVLVVLGVMPRTKGAKDKAPRTQAVESAASKAAKCAAKRATSMAAKHRLVQMLHGSPRGASSFGDAAPVVDGACNDDGHARDSNGAGSNGDDHRELSDRDRQPDDDLALSLFNRMRLPLLLKQSSLRALPNSLQISVIFASRWVQSCHSCLCMVRRSVSSSHNNF